MRDIAQRAVFVGLTAKLRVRRSTSSSTLTLLPTRTKYAPTHPTGVSLHPVRIEGFFVVARSAFSTSSGEEERSVAKARQGPSPSRRRPRTDARTS